MLRAGYIEDWTYHRTYSGTPQGGVISPILANVYLHELDLFMEKLCRFHSKEGKRRVNPEYSKYSDKIQWIATKLRMIDTPDDELSCELRGRKQRMVEKGQLELSEESRRILIEEKKSLLETRMNLPEKDPFDPDYERLCYMRYADDLLLGYAGGKEKADGLMTEVKECLVRELKLECSE